MGTLSLVPVMAFQRTISQQLPWHLPSSFSFSPCLWGFFRISLIPVSWTWRLRPQSSSLPSSFSPCIFLGDHITILFDLLLLDNNTENHTIQSHCTDTGDPHEPFMVFYRCGILQMWLQATFSTGFATAAPIFHVAKPLWLYCLPHLNLRLPRSILALSCEHCSLVYSLWFGLWIPLGVKPLHPNCMLDMATQMSYRCSKQHVQIKATYHVKWVTSETVFLFLWTQLLPASFLFWICFLFVSFELYLFFVAA